ncbi:mediator of RNA polymerase II transcription subunit 15a isoform X1 [Aegilops tauschii subsp. strangulata]|uniref:mediator of RNA polymerase II transcription subunit 15a isoform X1 n=1 Tax=Aegilops tauschii subsp. strangulata TaxID=200361 RepID=UPI00098AF24E|nr:mediator of RNA polymerase II transcription subunit 15a isoform X1 [Aegilops tauschii subsp. strangulata]
MSLSAAIDSLSIYTQAPSFWSSVVCTKLRTECLKKHLQVLVPEGLNKLEIIVVRFEEKIYTAATSQGSGGNADGRREVRGLDGVVAADVRRGQAAAHHLPLAPQHTGCGAHL